MKLLFITSSLLFVMVQFVVAQKAISKDDVSTTKYFKIDTTLKKEIELERINWEIMNPLKKFAGGLMNVEIFVNDKESFSTYGKDKIEYFFPFQTVNEKDSVILIVGAFGTQTENSGFEIYIYKNECLVFFVTKKDGDQIFKRKNENYKSYVKTPTQYHLTLVRKPTFKKGEIIEGLVEMRSWVYYVKTTKGDEKRNVNIFAYFRTKPL